jgi:RNA polymerase sigma-70 factor (ECF subfamily)
MSKGPLISPDLIGAWQRGEEDAVRAVFEVCYPRAVRLGALSGLDTDRAQDCAQDAFVHAFERREQLRDPEAFAVWFHRIVTRAVLDALIASNKKSPSLPDDEDMAEDWCRTQAPLPDDVALNNERRDDLWRRVEKLPPSYRVPLVLRYYHGFATREVADILGVSDGAMRVTLHRAVQRLRLAFVAEGVQRESILPS